jgi:hypothetical protein
LVFVLWLCEWLSLCACESAAAPKARATATAEIVAPLRLSKVSDLQFAGVVVGERPGTVTLATTGRQAATGGVSVVEGSAGRAAAFGLGGARGSYAVLLPQAVVLHSGVDRLQIDSFTHDGGDALEGATQMHVGATLHVAPRQPSGSYVGDFDFTVSYN